MGEETKTILVVDDEPDIVTYLTTLLEDNGYATVAAVNGVEAMSRVEEARPDLITLDITMPEKSGVRFYREMKTSAALQGVPIVIVTGVSADFERFISTRGKVPPPEGFITKPIDQEKILELIARLVSA